MFNCFKFRKNKIIDNCNNKIDEYNIEIECIICLNSYNSSKIKAFIPCGHRNCCNNCINIIKNDKLILELYQVLIYNYSNNILSNQTHGILNLIINNDYKNISQIYRLFSNNYNLLNVINSIFDNVISTSLSDIINEFKFEKKTTCVESLRQRPCAC